MSSNTRFDNNSGLVIGNKENVHHETDHFPGGEMFSGRFIGGFRKPPDEFFEDEPHLFIGNLIGMKIDRGKFLNDHEKKVLAVQVGDLFSESEPFEDIPGVLGKVSKIGLKVLSDMLGIIQEFGEGKASRRIKFLARNFQEKGGEVCDPGIFSGFIFLENLIFRGFENAIQSAKDGKGQDDFSVVSLLVISPEQIGNRPKKGCLSRKV